ncbi:hypothetical protein TELCIR_14541, partial [Teladorsagia circumcincta]
SDDESSDEEDEEEEAWPEDVVGYDRFAFAEECGPHMDVEECEEPSDYFELFLNDELLDLIVLETNRYGRKEMQDKEKEWTDTTVEEIKKFLGICLYMGLVRLPKLRDYWDVMLLYRHGELGEKEFHKAFAELCDMQPLPDSVIYIGEEHLTMMVMLSYKDDE